MSIGQIGKTYLTTYGGNDMKNKAATFRLAIEGEKPVPLSPERRFFIPDKNHKGVI